MNDKKGSIVLKFVQMDLKNVFFRYNDLQKRLQSGDAKPRDLERLAQREQEYLRLRRVRLGADDFATIKVIGKGAFGEVR